MYSNFEINRIAKLIQLFEDKFVLFRVSRFDLKLVLVKIN